MANGFKLIGYNSDDELPLWAIRSKNQRAKQRQINKNKVVLKDNEWFCYLVNNEYHYYKVAQNLPNYLGIKQHGFKDAGTLLRKFRPDEKICVYCECALTFENKTRDHIIPRRLKGKITKPCCFKCNQEKGGLMLHSYIQLLNLKWTESITGSQEYNLLNTKIKNANKLAKEITKG